MDLIGGSSGISPVSARPICRLLTTRVPSGIEIGAANDVELVGVLPDRELGDAAADVAPRARQSRNAADGADGLAAAVMPLECDAHADCGRLSGRQLARELADVVSGDAGDLLGPFRRARAGAFLQFIEADRVIVDVVLIDEALRDDRVDERHRQRAVRAGLGANVPVGFLGRARSVSVDNDDLGAELLRIAHDRPVMQVGADAVAGPDDDVLGMNVALRIETGGRADRQQPSRARAFAAERALAYGRAQAVEKGVTAVEAVHQPLMPEVAVRDDRLRAVFGDDGLPARDDLIQCFIPRDAFELLGPLRPNAPHWIKHAVGMVVAGLVVLQLHAKTAARHGMIGIAAHALQLAVFHIEQHRARVGQSWGQAPKDVVVGDTLVHGFPRFGDWVSTAQRAGRAAAWLQRKAQNLAPTKSQMRTS